MGGAGRVQLRRPDRAGRDRGPRLRQDRLALAHRAGLRPDLPAANSGRPAAGGPGGHVPAAPGHDHPGPGPRRAGGAHGAAPHPAGRHLRAAVRHRAARAPVLRGPLRHAPADPPPRAARPGLSRGEHDVPDQPGRRVPGGRDPGGGPRRVPLAGPGRTVVLPVGRADHRLGPATAVQRGDAGPAAALPRQGPLPHLPPACGAHARPVRLAGWVRDRARGPGRAVRALPGRRPGHHRAADVRDAGGHRGRASWSSGGCPGRTNGSG